MDWNEIRPVSYNKRDVDPYTRTRVILMNGTEFEANWFSHQFSRNCDNNDVRRALALIRRSEQMQQKLISLIKPVDETLLEHTIGYEQLAVDLTAQLARHEPDQYVKKALDFALLEDFDHLYRYADFLDMETNEKAEELVGRYTEIMPGRPTVSEYRHPFDSIRYHIDNKKAAPQTRLCVGIITAAEQQTMNYYMNIAPFYSKSDLGRRLYQEIGMIEEQHVTQYESLKDTNATWLEDLLMHEYTECYLYYSCMMTECDSAIRRIWEECLIQEIAHLHKAKDLLWKYEHKDWMQVIGGGDFPELLVLRPNVDYVREIIRTTTGNTHKEEMVVPLVQLPMDDRFYWYQNTVNHDVCEVASHEVIEQRINRKGMDYRFELGKNPLCELRDRCNDNTQIGRDVSATPLSTMICGTSQGCCKCEADTECGTVTF